MEVSAVAVYSSSSVVAHLGVYLCSPSFNRELILVAVAVVDDWPLQSLLCPEVKPDRCGQTVYIPYALKFSRD